MGIAVGAVDDYLKNNLPGYQKMEKQGSYALGTLINPVGGGDEYDADVQVVMDPNPKWEPRDYINQVQPDAVRQQDLRRQAEAEDQVRDG